MTELPITAATLPAAFLLDLQRNNDLCVVEEHVAHGGAGQMLAHALLLRGQTLRRFQHRCATGYPSGRYGSQIYHRKDCGLDPASVLAALT